MPCCDPREPRNGPRKQKLQASARISAALLRPRALLPSSSFSRMPTGPNRPTLPGRPANPRRLICRRKSRRTRGRYFRTLSSFQRFETNVDLPIRPTPLWRALYFRLQLVSAGRFQPLKFRQVRLPNRADSSRSAPQGKAQELASELFPAEFSARACAQIWSCSRRALSPHERVDFALGDRQAPGLATGEVSSISGP